MFGVQRERFVNVCRFGYGLKRTDCVNKWILNCDDDDEEGGRRCHFLKQLAVIDKEINFLYKLHHPNIVNYQHMTYTKDEKCLTVYVLKEFVVRDMRKY